MGIMLAKSGLLENFSEPEAEFRLERLNDVLSTFAGDESTSFARSAKIAFDALSASP